MVVSLEVKVQYQDQEAMLTLTVVKDDKSPWRRLDTVHTPELESSPQRQHK